MKNQLITSMLSFTLGTGATLVALSTWLGTTDLEEIKYAVQNYMVEVEQHSSALAQDYQVTVENANAEIGEYKVALEQANDNISQLITAYEQQEQQAQDDLAELQTELDRMKQKLDQQYELDMNTIIIEANRQIDNANYEVAETKEKVNEYISTSQVDEIVENAKQLKDQLDTGNDKSVQDISSIVPQE